jgi:D-glycero-D-manno-heptose 1,7-bisphosphate phosphatase
LTRAAFLDRDGVLNAKPPAHDYIRSPDEFVLLPGVVEAVRLLRDGGFAPIVVSNQRGVARGLVTCQTLTAIEKRMRDAGVVVERYYYCPHDFDAGCSCRKPRPGMLLSAAAEMDIDLRRSVLIGDAESDILAGRAAGCFTVLVGRSETVTSADAVAADLLDAARLVTAAAPPQAGTAAR